MNDCVLNTDLAGLKPFLKGKVRDVYELDSSRLLIVATDRISAFDVIRQIRQNTLMKHPHLLADALFIFAFQHLEQQGKLCHLYCLMININSVNVIQKNPLPFAGRQPPFPFIGLIDAGGFAF